uniref:Uncharacterized protein n=1 Tax=Cacopsylla melanoneura TaxID=428564 RepID=A0A8D8S845_9HEMI
MEVRGDAIDERLLSAVLVKVPAATRTRVVSFPPRTTSAARERQSVPGRLPARVKVRSVPPLRPKRTRRGAMKALNSASTASAPAPFVSNGACKSVSSLRNRTQTRGSCASWRAQCPLRMKHRGGASAGLRRSSLRVWASPRAVLVSGPDPHVIIFRVTAMCSTSVGRWTLKAR